ncbi:MAG: hypothetical protein MZV63_52090 [Marinilabiliales bacterium]|nr:hypothetical protein [Marinilabiliales bacterium]
MKSRKGPPYRTCLNKGRGVFQEGRSHGRCVSCQGDPRIVVACGGGTPCSAENMDIMKVNRC